MWGGGEVNLEIGGVKLEVERWGRTGGRMG